MRRALLVALCGALIATPALAGTVTLKADVADGDGRVTLGDLFDGAAARRACWSRPASGPSVVLDAAAVQARPVSGLDWSNPQGLRRIVVRRRRGRQSCGHRPARHVEVLTWARSLNAGRHCPARRHDLGQGVRRAGRRAAWDADAVIGMAAKRPLARSYASPAMSRPSR